MAQLGVLFEHNAQFFPPARIIQFGNLLSRNRDPTSWMRGGSCEEMDVLWMPAVLVGAFVHEPNATASLSQAHRDSNLSLYRQNGARFRDSGADTDD